MGNNQFGNAFEYKVIYIFGINDSAHAGYLKIGDASLHTNTPIDKLAPNSKELNQAALARIKSYTNTAGVKPNLYHTELAVRNDKKKGLVAFRDYNVHDVLKNSGIPNVTIDGSTGKEWFDVDIDKCLSTYEEFIKNETLTLEIVKEIKGETYDINDHETYLDVERV